MRLNILPDEINLLYIENNTHIVELIKEYLKTFRHTKFNVTYIKTLKEGLDYLDKECRLEEDCDVDVILLDLNLPNSTGVNTFREIKAKCDFLPIVIISEFEEIACECVKYGAQDYLIKNDISAGILVRSLKYSIERTKLEGQFKNIIQTSSLGYHVYCFKDGNTEDLFFCGTNPAADKILKFDNTILLNKKIGDAFPNLPQSIIQHYRGILKGEIDPIVNQTLEYQDERISQANFRFNAYKSDERLVVTFEDITIQVKTRHELEERERQYKSLVEVTGAGIYGIDFVNGKFTYVNDVMCSQLGYTRDELMQKGPADILTKRSVEVWANRFAAMGRGEFIDETVEYEATKKDGSIMWVLITADYIEDADENITGANVVAIDITEKKEAEIALKRKEVEVYETLENKIQQWRNELDAESAIHRNTIETADISIKTIFDKDDVEVL